MTHVDQIEKELALGDAAFQEANEGKARVCARRAVALAAEATLKQLPQVFSQGDALHHLRQIQQEESFPLPIRQAAERLTTKVTERDRTPFTSNPIADARLIIGHLMPKGSNPLKGQTPS